jgi:hypothetical protein
MGLLARGKALLASAQVAMGIQCFQRGEWDDAAAFFKRAIGAGDHRRAPGYLLEVGLAYNKRGGAANREKVVDCFAHAALAGYPPAILNMGLIAREQGHRAGALKCFHEAAMADQSPEMDIAIAAIRNIREMEEEDEQEERERARSRGRRPEPGQREREGQQDGRQSGGGNGKMSRATALEMLELKEGATPPEMKAAWMRLMQQNHPDKGGSNYFAKQLNEAREVLGF